MRSPNGILGWIGAATLAVLMAPATPAQQGDRGPVSISATEVAEIRQTSAIVNRMVRNGDLRAIRVVGDPLVPGRLHERLAQYQDGLRVFGTDVTRQTDGGLTTSIFGRLHTNIQLDTVPTLSANDAVAVVDTPRHRNFGSPASPELMILHAPVTDTYQLVYQVRVFSAFGPVVSFVDAHSGAIVREYGDIKTQNVQLPCTDCAIGEGFGVKGDRKKISVRTDDGTFLADDVLRPPPIITYDMQGDWERTLDVLGGFLPLADADLARDSDNKWLDGAAVDAHVGTGWFYDYLFHQFGRRGLDGNNGPIVSLVHPIRRADFFQVPDDVVTLFHLNAFFCAACGPHSIIVYGEGLPPGLMLGSTGQSVDFFSAGLDIVAHELGHAITDSTSGLIYQNESGALNEAFSDVLAVGTEFFMAESGRHPFEQPDYLIGEDVLKPGGMRSLAAPRTRGDPDHYSLRFTGTFDNGGVHTNSLIATHAFYLAVEGGVNQTSGIEVSGVGGSSRRQVEQAFYRAFVFLLPANATFSIARAATVQSARELVGSSSNLADTIAAAWTAVGVE